MSKTDGDCIVLWIYRFMKTASVAGNKLTASYACVCVGEDDKVLGGTVSELNPEKLRACFFTRSKRSTRALFVSASLCFVPAYSLQLSL